MQVNIQVRLGNGAIDNIEYLAVKVELILFQGFGREDERLHEVVVSHCEAFEKIRFHQFIPELPVTVSQEG